MALSQAYKMGRSPKKITAKNIMTLIQFSQNLMQGGWINKDAFCQLPGFNDAEAKKAKTLLGGQTKTIYNYCTSTEAQRLEWAPQIFGDDFKTKFDEQEKCIQALPIVRITMTAFVDGEEDIVVGDILTCKLRVDYLNLEKGQKSGYVHSKHYPYLRRDQWFLMITDEQFSGLAAVEKLSVQDNFFEKEFKERVGRTGKIAFTAVLTNDSYKGLDQVAKVEVNVIEESKTR